MAAARVPDKWRPTLALIVFVVLLTVLALPAAIVIWFRSFDHTGSRMGTTEIGALGVALLLTVIIAVVFSRTITGPINALVKRTDEIRRGGRAAIRSPEQLGTREIAVLSQSFIDLAERLVDRTEYVSSFAAHVSHEFKSPLTAIRGSAELLRDAEMSGEERRKFLEHIIADSDRLAALLERLRELARADLDAAPGVTVLDDLLSKWGWTDAFPGIKKTGNLTLPVALGPDAVKAILGQLFRNATEHGATEITLSGERGDGVLKVIVADNGSGISAGNRERVFEPFFTTRREAGGTGMGLQIVRSMLAAHGGGIQLLENGGGARFELTLPLA